MNIEIGKSKMIAFQYQWKIQNDKTKLNRTWIASCIAWPRSKWQHQQQWQNKWYGPSPAPVTDRHYITSSKSTFWNSSNTQRSNLIKSQRNENIASRTRGNINVPIILGLKRFRKRSRNFHCMSSPRPANRHHQIPALWKIRIASAMCTLR